MTDGGSGSVREIAARFTGGSKVTVHAEALAREKDKRDDELRARTEASERQRRGSASYGVGGLMSAAAALSRERREKALEEERARDMGGAAAAHGGGGSGD